LLTRRSVLTRALTVGSAVLLSACTAPLRLPTGAPSPTAVTAETPRAGGTLRMAKVGDIVSAGAPFLLTPANLHLFPLVYDSLVTYDTHFTPQPRLASSWQWSADARRLTLNLRPSVRFHGGRAFTSVDAKVNLEHQRDPAIGSIWRNYVNSMQISAPDPLTLVIDYDTPARGSFDVLAGTLMPDPQSLDDTNAGRGFTGTGPFRFQEWVPGDHLIVTRNVDYWQPGKPYLDRVELHIMNDAQSAVVALEAGSVDWVSGVPGLDARRLQSDPTYQVMLTATGGTFYYLGLDVAQPALADQRVRQALSFALNRQRMVDTALAGYGRPASVPWPQASAWYDAAQDATYSFDLNRARQLLQSAGLGATSLAALTLALPSSSPLTSAMAAIYQADLASLGITLTIQQLETVDFFSRMLGGGFGGLWMASMGTMNLSPATFLSSAVPVRVPNPSHFDAQRYRELTAQVAVETNDAQLAAEVHEITQILLDQAFVGMIAEATDRDAGPEVALARVRNAVWNVFGLFAFEDVWLAR
jgi:peptide/nickel transport system substrate-binding protein